MDALIDDTSDKPLTRADTAKQSGPQDESIQEQKVPPHRLCLYRRIRENNIANQ